MAIQDFGSFLPSDSVPGGTGGGNLSTTTTDLVNTIVNDAGTNAALNLATLPAPGTNKAGLLSPVEKKKIAEEHGIYKVADDAAKTTLGTGWGAIQEGNLAYQLDSNVLYQWDGAQFVKLDIGFERHVNAFCEGCDPTGGTVSNAKFIAAFTKAKTEGVPLYFPAGTYDLTGITTQDVTGEVEVFGEGLLSTKIIGTGELFRLKDASSFRATGIHFDGFDVVAKTEANAVYKSIDIAFCKFSNITHAALGGQVNFIIKSWENLKFCHNDCQDFGAPGTTDSTCVVAMQGSDPAFANFSYSNIITNNYLKGIGSATQDGFVAGFYIATHEESKDSFSLVAQNTIRELTNNSLSSLNGIIILGSRANITGNNIDRLIPTNAATVDCEGIYVKTRHGVISNNILTNAGGREACIAIKGMDRDEPYTTGQSPRSHDIMVANNQIYQDAAVTTGYRTIGIYTTVSGCVFRGNHIEGTQRGIAVSNGFATANGNINTEISNNTMRKLFCHEGAGGAVYGIDISNPQDVRAYGNKIYEADASAGALAYGFNVTNQGGQTAKKLQLENNHVEGLVAGNTRAFAFSIVGTMEELDMRHNYADGAAFAMICNGDANISLIRGVGNESGPNIVNATLGFEGFYFPTTVPKDTGGYWIQYRNIIEGLGRFKRSTNNLAAQSGEEIIIVATHNINLPAAPADGTRVIFVPATGDWSTNGGDITPGAGDTINGSATLSGSGVVLQNTNVATVVYDAANTNWLVFG